MQSGYTVHSIDPYKKTVTVSNTIDNKFIIWFLWTNLNEKRCLDRPLSHYKDIQRFEPEKNWIKNVKWSQCMNSAETLYLYGRYLHDQIDLVMNWNWLIPNIQHFIFHGSSGASDFDPLLKLVNLRKNTLKSLEFPIWAGISGSDIAYIDKFFKTLSFCRVLNKIMFSFSATLENMVPIMQIFLDFIAAREIDCKSLFPQPLVRIVKEYGMSPFLFHDFYSNQSKQIEVLNHVYIDCTFVLHQNCMGKIYKNNYNHQIEVPMVHFCDWFGALCSDDSKIQRTCISNYKFSRRLL
jgi:hypothetical protein